MADDVRVRTARLTLMATPAGSDPDARRHLRNRSSHGVGSRNGKETGTEEDRSQARREGEGGRAEEQGVEERESCEERRQLRRAATAAKGAKYVYAFGRKTDGNGSMKPLLGGKGANLAEMCRIGLPVPPGFTITTEVCTYYYANKRTYPPALRAADGERASPPSSSRPARSSAI